MDIGNGNGNVSDDNDEEAVALFGSVRTVNRWVGFLLFRPDTIDGYRLLASTSGIGVWLCWARGAWLGVDGMCDAGVWGCVIVGFGGCSVRGCVSGCDD